jgi:thioredoxin-related protein
MHRDGFSRPEIKAELGKFDVVRLTLADRSPVTTPSGTQTTADAWARALKIAYTPTIVFFDGGREVFRTEAYVRPFHLASSFEYVSSRAYRKEPSFQRFVQARAERLREKGVAIDLMR